MISMRRSTGGGANSSPSTSTDMIVVGPNEPSVRRYIATVCSPSGSPVASVYVCMPPEVSRFG